MASVIYNEFKRANAAGEIDLNADDIRVALLMSNTTADTENDTMVYVGDFTTLDECDGANYVRKALANEAVNKDDANDRAEFDADDVTWSALGVGTRQTVGALLYEHVTNDADSPIIAYVEFSGAVTHDGSNFTIEWSAEGILQLT
jgi:hypothetical protein